MTWPPNYLAVYAFRQKQVLACQNNPALIRGAKKYYETNPADWISHWCDTYDPRQATHGLPTTMPFILFKRQRELVEFFMQLIDNQTGGLVEKSRDMGATWLACAFSVWLWLFFPGVSIGWGSRKEHLVDRRGDPDAIFEKIRILLRGLPFFFLPQNFDFREHMTFLKIVNPETGSTISGESGYELGRGGRKTIYFKDESAHYRQAEIIEAAISECTNVQVDISSVRGVGNIFHRRRESGIEWTGESVVKDRVNVFVMDWRDHPAKDEQWYAQKRLRAEHDGLLPVFQQEIDRQYGALIKGTLIPYDWLASCLDAHVALQWPMPELIRTTAGLDVADTGADSNALAIRANSIIFALDEWFGTNTSVTARRAVHGVSEYAPCVIQYDATGVGAGIRAEVEEQAELCAERKITFLAWHGGAKVRYPDRRVIYNDSSSPKNKDYYENLKAQAWWAFRARVEKTHKSREAGTNLYPIDDMISFDTNLKLRYKLLKELTQVTTTFSRAQKIKIDKSPEGLPSPNLADAVVMSSFPLKGAYTLEHV